LFADRVAAMLGVFAAVVVGAVALEAVLALVACWLWLLVRAFQVEQPAASATMPSELAS
jgi:hypothetical protein